MTDTAVTTDPLLSVEDLHVSFGRGNQTVQAVAGITFSLRQGETLGLVGESGCGKSTTGRAIVQVEKATSGRIRFGDTELTSLSRGDLRTLRTQVQMIFQDPISSLNPPKGCPFSPRCPYAQDRCHVEKPPLVEAEPGHSYACWFPLTSADPAAASPQPDPVPA